MCDQRYFFPLISLIYFSSSFLLGSSIRTFKSFLLTFAKQNTQPNLIRFVHSSFFLAFCYVLAMSSPVIKREEGGLENSQHPVQVITEQDLKQLVRSNLMKNTAYSDLVEAKSLV